MSTFPPAESRATPLAAGTESSDVGTAGLAHTTSQARLLVVDDEDTNIRLLERILRRAGYTEIQPTTDPTGVPALCAAYQPDLILLDLRMPGRDGFGVLEDLAAQLQGDERVPVLMLTGDASPETKRRALALGAKDFVAKPFDFDEIVLRIRNLLETRALHRALAEQNAFLEQRVQERTRELEDAQMEVLARLAAAAEFRDDDTGQHTQRVGDLAARIAATLGLPTDQVELLRRAAPLHDVGKIAIPDKILRKPDRLTPAEFDVLKAHTTTGAHILAGGGSPLVVMAERIARSHHERWDGTGYPEGLAGEQIPLEARIVSVADLLDSLTHAGPCRPAWPVDQVLDLIARGHGTHFDPAVVDALLTEYAAGATGVAETAGDPLRRPTAHE